MRERSIGRITGSCLSISSFVDRSTRGPVVPWGRAIVSTKTKISNGQTGGQFGEHVAGQDALHSAGPAEFPFNARKLEALLEEQGIDLLLVTSKHNIQYLLGGYRFFFLRAHGRNGLEPLSADPGSAAARFRPILLRWQPHRALATGRRAAVGQGTGKRELDQPRRRDARRPADPQAGPGEGQDCGRVSFPARRRGLRAQRGAPRGAMGRGGLRTRGTARYQNAGRTATGQGSFRRRCRIDARRHALDPGRHAHQPHRGCHAHGGNTGAASPSTTAWSPLATASSAPARPSCAGTRARSFRWTRVGHKTRLHRRPLPHGCHGRADPRHARDPARGPAQSNPQRASRSSPAHSAV